MQKIWAIALNDLRIIFREKDIWINLIVLPLILSFVIGYANGAGQQPSDPTAPDILIDVIDRDDSESSRCEPQLCPLRGFAGRGRTLWNRRSGV